MKGTQYRPVKIGEDTMPESIKSEIVARFMKPSELKSFYDSYKDARKRDGWAIKVPTERDRKMAMARKKGESYTSLSKTFGIKPHQVMAAIRRVALYEFMNS